MGRGEGADTESKRHVVCFPHFTGARCPRPSPQWTTAVCNTLHRLRKQVDIPGGMEGRGRVWRDTGCDRRKVCVWGDDGRGGESVGVEGGGVAQSRS